MFLSSSEITAFSVVVVPRLLSQNLVVFYFLQGNENILPPLRFCGVISSLDEIKDCISYFYFFTKDGLLRTYAKLFRKGAFSFWVQKQQPQKKFLIPEQAYRHLLAHREAVRFASKSQPILASSPSEKQRAINAVQVTVPFSEFFYAFLDLSRIDFVLPSS